MQRRERHLRSNMPKAMQISFQNAPAQTCQVYCGKRCARAFGGQMSRGAEPGDAQLHKGASDPAMDTCCLCPVWNTGCVCGNEYCRLRRSKTIRSAQCYEYGSVTEPYPFPRQGISATYWRRYHDHGRIQPQPCSKLGSPARRFTGQPREKLLKQIELLRSDFLKAVQELLLFRNMASPLF